MKRFVILIFTLFLGCNLMMGQSKKAKEEMAFDKVVDGIVTHDFGSIVYGANGNVDFTFTNKGTKDLIINDVQSSCGCAVPSWTKEPVKPGQTGSVKVNYNTKLPGPFNKTIAVFSNADNSPVRLVIRGKVNAQPSDLKPGAPTPDQQKVIDQKAEEEYQKKAANEGTSGVDPKIGIPADKVAQKEAYKKMVQQREAAKNQTTTTGTQQATQKTTSTATKK
ncbi:MAG: DUF1573 domain-containing protein [Bacteroidota bacterium]